MHKGGQIYTQQSLNIFRFAGLFVPIVLIIYGIFIQFDFIDTVHSIDNTGLIILSFWSMYVSILQFLVPSKSKLDSCLRLVAYHLLTGSYLIFISGIASPFVACWLLLMLASYIYFSERGLQLSIFAFIATIAIDILFWNRINSTAITFDLVALVAILVVGLVILSINRSQEVTRNVLNRSKSKEQLQRDRIETIVNNMTDAVISTDVDGVVRIYNAASLNLLDTNDSLNGHHIDEILPLFDKNDNQISLYKDLVNTKSVKKRDDRYFAYDNNDKIRLEITYSPIRKGYSRTKKSETHDGYVIIIRDITKEKSLEDERDEFVSVISHELRTPITIAEGSISNVQIMMDHPDTTNGMLRDSVNIAHDQIIFLANMVNDLSALSRAERGVSDNAQKIDVRELAHELINKYKDEAKVKKLQLDLDLSQNLDNVYASKLYLEELLQNLITNAIKYTKTGSVKIIIEQNNEMIEFAVKDTGVGISKTDQVKIFDKFYRSEDYRTRETSGTGLGLYVASKLAHKLGTKIRLKSRLNFGSTFSFSLPRLKS